jgi:hypothetical protein
MPIDTTKTVLQVEGNRALTKLWKNVQNEGIGILYRGSIAQAAATAVGHFPWFLTYNYLDVTLPMISRQEDLFLSLCRSALLGLSASCVSDCCSNSLRVIKTTKQTIALGTTQDRSSSNETTFGTDLLSSSNENNNNNKNTTATTRTNEANNNNKTIIIVKTDNGTQSSLSSSSSAPTDLSYPEIVTSIIEKDGLIGLFGRGLQTRLLTNAIQGAVFSIVWKYFQSQ